MIIDKDTVYVVGLRSGVAVSGRYPTELACAFIAVWRACVAVDDIENITVCVRADRAAGSFILRGVHAQPAVLRLIGVQVGDPALIILDRLISQVDIITVFYLCIDRKISHLGVFLRLAFQDRVDDQRYDKEKKGHRQYYQAKDTRPAADHRRNGNRLGTDGSNSGGNNG